MLGLLLTARTVLPEAPTASMMCQAAQRLLSAERDGALGPTERALLGEHLKNCSSCQQFQTTLAVAMSQWRDDASTATVPDPERAWLDIRREIRTAAPTRTRVSKRAMQWSIPLAAAGALASAFVFFPRHVPEGLSSSSLARLEKPHADFVEVPNDASSLVYVDDQSGWLVVWAVNDESRRNGG